MRSVYVNAPKKQPTTNDRQEAVEKLLQLLCLLVGTTHICSTVLQSSLYILATAHSGYLLDNIIKFLPFHVLLPHSSISLS